MIQKSQSPVTTSQLKRTLHTSTPHDQPIDAYSSIQQLISRIQSTILQTSESMKQHMTSFQQHQLINYKNDLLKTQQEFIKIRAQRNEDAVKAKMLKQKSQVQQKFNTQIGKLMEMNVTYQKMKGLAKRMNEDQRQLIMEINYVKKKIETELKEGEKLEEEIKEMMERGNNINGNGKRSEQRGSKVDEERRLFKELVNKCQQNENNNNAKKVRQGQDNMTKPNIVVENYTKKMERRLKYEISNLKDYIKNIPLDLNFVENMLYSSTREKFEKAKMEVKEEFEEQEKEQKEEGKEDNKGEEIVDRGSNQEEKETQKMKEEVGQQNKNNGTVKQKELIKLPNITNMNFLSVQTSKKLNNNKQNLHKQPKTLARPPKTIQIKSNIVQKQKLLKQNQEIPNTEQLLKSSALLQEILSDPQVKEYLYRVLFKDSGVEQEE